MNEQNKDIGEVFIHIEISRIFSDDDGIHQGILCDYSEVALNQNIMEKTLDKLIKLVKEKIKEIINTMPNKVKI